MPPLRLLHTADWQLGLRAAQLGERAGDVRSERLSALERTVDLALEHRVDLVIAAGDLFDCSAVDEAVVRAAVASLERLAPTPVALLPGNHDPDEPAGVWTRRVWRGAGEHLHVLTASEEAEILPGVALYPCPLTQRQSQLDPSAWIPQRTPGDQRLRVGVAHGALASLPGAVNFPIAPDRAELCDLDYLALGDWHGVRILGRTAYPGTIEQTSFGERLAGWVLVVELERGEAPQIAQHRVGRLVWRQLEGEVRELADVDRMAAEIEELGTPDAVLLRVRVTVLAASGEVLRELELLERSLRDALLFLDWQVTVLELDALEPGDGILGAVDESLEECLRAAGGEETVPSELAEVDGLADATSEVLREARLHLRRLIAAASLEGGR